MCWKGGGGHYLIVEVAGDAGSDARYRLFTSTRSGFIEFLFFLFLFFVK